MYMTKFSKLLARYESYQTNEGLLDKIKLNKGKKQDIVELTIQDSIITDKAQLAKTQFQYKGESVSELIEKNWSKIVGYIEGELYEANSEELEEQNVDRNGYLNVTQWDYQEDIEPKLVYFDKYTSSFWFYSISKASTYFLPDGVEEDDEEFDFYNPDNYELKRNPNYDRVVITKVGFITGGISSISCEMEFNSKGSEAVLQEIVKSHLGKSQEIS